MNKITIPKKQLIATTILSVCLLVSARAHAVPHIGPLDSNVIHEQVLSLIDAIAVGDFDTALSTGRQLTTRYPSYHLGQLLYAELLTHRGNGNGLINSDQAYPARLLELMLEAQARIRTRRATQTPVSSQSGITAPVSDSILTDLHGENQVTPKIPDNLIQVGAHTRHIVVADLSSSTLYLLENNAPNNPVLIDTHYIAIGAGGAGKSREGDLRTPVGIYELEQFRPDESLPPLYGAGALTLNYPNVLDRLNQRKGSGIWLHGMPQRDMARAPLSSEGCVVLPNDSLRDLHRQIELDSTVVVLADGVNWITPKAAEKLGQDYLGLFEEFRRQLTVQVTSASAEPLTRNKQLPVSRLMTNEHNKHTADISTRLNDQMGGHKSVAQTHTESRKSLKTYKFQNLNYARSIPLDLLAHVDPQDISIFSYPEQPNTGSSKSLASHDSNNDFGSEGAQTHDKLLIMQFQVPPPSLANGQPASRITLYWSQVESNTWEIMHYTIDAEAI